MPELKDDRAALLAGMQQPLRGQAQKNIDLYAELCGDKIPQDALEKGMNALWLQSVTGGSESYQTYLVSPLWQRISGDVLLRDRHMCAACRREAEVVHHRSYDYETMAGLDDRRLISLCNPCHHYIHFHNGEKTLPEAWEKRLQELRKFFSKKQKKRHP